MRQLVRNSAALPPHTESEVLMTEALRMAYVDRSKRMRTVFALVMSCSACAFPDPNAPPPPDPLLVGPPEPPVGGKYYTVKVDGIPTCPDSPRGDEEDTILVFTGAAWNRESVLRRAQNPFFGLVTPNTPVTAASVHVDDPFEDAIGTCTVNAGTGTEITMVSVCGQRAAGKSGCETSLATTQKEMDGLTAVWSDCPGEGALCPELPSEPCLSEPGDGMSYAAYLDIGPIRCGDRGQPDDRDTLLVTTRSGYSINTAACLSQGPYVWATTVGSSHEVVRGSFQLANAPLIHSAMTTGLVVAGAGKTGAPSVAPLGYCLVYEGEQLEYVLYSFCDEVTLPDAEFTDPAALEQWSPAALCAGLTRDGHTLTSTPRSDVRERADADGGVLPVVTSKLVSGRPSRWFSCSGPAPGPLCFGI